MYKNTDDKYQMFRNRLTKVFRHLSKQAKRQGITSYRVYDHDLPEFPLCIEIFGNKLYVAEYKRRHGMKQEEHMHWLEKSLAIAAEVLGVRKEEVYCKLRQRKPGRSGQYRTLKNHSHEVRPLGDVFLKEDEFVVEEGGLQFIINLNTYLDTGLFLDHRLTRQMIKKQSPCKRILNLFAYNGSFSVYAAAGGAAEVVTVDLSNTYLNWAERNMKLNYFSDKEKYKFIRADVKQYLKLLPEAYYDIIIMDPPTFSNSKKMDDILDIQRDHPELINDCLKGLKTGGKLYFSTHFRKFELQADKLNTTSIKDITNATTPFDFAGRLRRCCYLLSK